MPHWARCVCTPRPVRSAPRCFWRALPVAAWQTTSDSSSLSYRTKYANFLTTTPPRARLRARQNSSRATRRDRHVCFRIVQPHETTDHRNSPPFEHNRAATRYSAFQAMCTWQFCSGVLHTWGVIERTLPAGVARHGVRYVCMMALF